MNLRNLRSFQGVSRCLITAAFALTLLSPVFSGAKKSLVFFPFGLGDEVMETQGYRLQDELSKAVRATLEKSGQFMVVGFSRTHASVKRALAEGSLRSALLLEPYTGRADGMPKAVTLGRLVRGELGFAGVVEQWVYSPAKKEATLVATIELYDVSAAKMLGSVVITSKAAGDSEREAASAAASKFAQEAVPQAIAILTAPPKKGGDG